ncbi:hypothetical protein MMC25_007628 [Agyrium rufum]|nr:hypothetical protein [Agyrium rufum]
MRNHPTDLKAQKSYHAFKDEQRFWRRLFEHSSRNAPFPNTILASRGRSWRMQYETFAVPPLIYVAGPTMGDLYTDINPPVVLDYYGKKHMGIFNYGRGGTVVLNERGKASYTTWETCPPGEWQQLQFPPIYPAISDSKPIKALKPKQIILVGRSVSALAKDGEPWIWMELDSPTRQLIIIGLPPELELRLLTISAGLTHDAGREQIAYGKIIRATASKDTKGHVHGLFRHRWWSHSPDPLQSYLNTYVTDTADQLRHTSFRRDNQDDLDCHWCEEIREVTQHASLGNYVVFLAHKNQLWLQVANVPGTDVGPGPPDRIQLTERFGIEKGDYPVFFGHHPLLDDLSVLTRHGVIYACAFSISFESLRASAQVSV